VLPFARVVDLAGAEVPIEPLVRAATDADVDAGVLSDEELYLLSPEPEAEPDPHFDAPRLAGLSAEQREVALASAVWVLRAHQLVRPTDSGELGFVGLTAVVGDVRANAEAAVRVRVDVRGEGSGRAVLYRARPDLFLTQQVGDEGLHRFTFRGAQAQARWLAAFVDPGAHARRTEPGRTAVRLDDLGITSEQLAAASASSALAVSLDADDPAPRRCFNAYGGADGLRVLHGWQRADDGDVRLQFLGPGDLVAFCAAFLAA
jgi:hypothetical protein